MEQLVKPAQIQQQEIMILVTVLVKQDIMKLQIKLYVVFVHTNALLVLLIVLTAKPVLIVQQEIVVTLNVIVKLDIFKLEQTKFVLNVITNAKHAILQQHHARVVVILIEI